MKNNWRYITIVLILAVLIGGSILIYSKQVNKEIISISQLLEIKKGSKETTLKKIKTGGEFGELVYYDGEIVVSGKYQESYPGTLFGGILCFFPDEKTGYLIPRDTNLHGYPDTRKPWFCFSDQKVAKSLFEIKDEEVFSDPTIKCIEGNATIRASNYIVNLVESEVSDAAQLKEIISKESYSTQC